MFHLRHKDDLTDRRLFIPNVLLDETLDLDEFTVLEEFV